MITIRLRFPASRYHANPWGRHVNEGVAEWPPSPYRLVRALYDVWQRKCSDLSSKEVGDALGELAAREPSYRMGRAAATHTRSYLSGNSYDPTEKNLVFDGFMAMERDAECFLVWPELELSDEQRRILDRLLENLNYLGRSESWIEAAIRESPREGAWRCEPLGTAESYDGEVTVVNCVIGPEEYKGSKPWLEALTVSTSDLMKAKASGPPLLKKVRYVLESGAVDMDPLTIRKPVQSDYRAALIGLDSTVLPLATATIEVAEQIRVRLMGAHRARMGNNGTKVSPLFSGKTADGEARKDHGHLYILPLSNGVGRINRVLLLSRLSAFRTDELDAIRGLRELWQADNRPKVRCVLTWQGSLEEVSMRPREKEVESLTPFVTARHWRRGRDMEAFLRDEVRRECSNHGLPDPIEVIKEEDQTIGLFHCVEYRRNRKEDPPRPGYRFRLRFAEPVSTPFSIGYGSHFGLGQFGVPQKKG